MLHTVQILNTLPAPANRSAPIVYRQSENYFPAPIDTTIIVGRMNGGRKSAMKKKKDRRGRPPKPEGSKVSHRIYIGLNHRDFAAFEKNREAAKLTATDFVRVRCCGGE